MCEREALRKTSKLQRFTVMAEELVGGESCTTDMVTHAAARRSEVNKVPARKSCQK